MRDKLNRSQVALLSSLARALFAASITFFLFPASPSYASNIAAITVAPMGIPFLLDDEGQVWAFRKPLSFEEPIKLPNLNHIKKIAPYIAVDTNGQVYTWSLNPIKTDWGEDGLNEAVYNTPQRVENLQGVTLVASSGDNYFVAVIGNKDIVEWLAIRDKSGLGAVTNGPIRTVISRMGVKAVTVFWTPEVVSTVGVVIYPVASSLVALFDEGTVMGWGIKPSGAATRGSDRKGILLTQSPGATEVSMNAMHTVILTANGVPQFWGGCDGYRDGKDFNGNQWPSRNNEGVDGYVVDVIGMSLFSGYDNVKPDVFIKRDGTVWAALAPEPSGMLGRDCYLSAGKKGQLWQLPAGRSAAVQVAAGESILMLDAEHKLWTTAGSWMNTKFHNVSINLK